MLDVTDVAAPAPVRSCVPGGIMSEQALPPAAVLVRHPVADFASWKQGFDDHQSVREKSGFLAHHLNQAEHDPNDVTVFLAASDLDRARAFASSDDLKEIMEEVGVVGPPEMTWLKPLREQAVWDRTLPAFILTHRVADVDAWLEGYDGAADLRASHGIIGEAANVSIDDPETVLVYHQAESFDDLRGFLDDAELKEVMAEAGVTSEPEITFVTGGHGKSY